MRSASKVGVSERQSWNEGLKKWKVGLVLDRDITVAPLQCVGRVNTVSMVTGCVADWKVGGEQRLWAK